MERSERLELISTLVDAEKSDDEIKGYFKDTLNLELSESTLYRDIKEVRKNQSASTPEDPVETPDPSSSEEEQPNPDDEEDQDEEDSEEDKEPSEDEKKAEEEATIKGLIEAIKEDREEELLESAQKELQPINFVNFKRLLNIAKGRVELEVSKMKAQEAKKDRAKFISDLDKNVGPAIKSIEKAQSEIQKAIKFKRKNGKNVRALVGIHKVLNRQIKTLGRQVNG